MGQGASVATSDAIADAAVFRAKNWAAVVNGTGKHVFVLFMEIRTGTIYCLDALQRTEMEDVLPIGKRLNAWLLGSDWHRTACTGNHLMARDEFGGPGDKVPFPAQRISIVGVADDQFQTDGHACGPIAIQTLRILAAAVANGVEGLQPKCAEDAVMVEHLRYRHVAMLLSGAALFPPM